MTMRWPWVSARYARFLENCYLRAIEERDAANRRADLAVDQLISFTGRAPISDVGITQQQAEQVIDERLQKMFGEDEGDFVFPQEVLEQSPNA